MGSFACRGAGCFCGVIHRDVMSGKELQTGMFVCPQDFILEHYSEDADKYMGAIQDFTDIRQVNM